MPKQKLNWQSLSRHQLLIHSLVGRVSSVERNPTLASGSQPGGWELENQKHVVYG
jgi:hypothetical protein